MNYLVGPFTADNVNLLMNDYVAGLPSPSAFMGLASVVSHQLTGERWSSGVLPILHEVSPSNGRRKPELTLKSGRFKPIEIPETFEGRVVFSLVLSLPRVVDDQDLHDSFVGRSLAGGALFGDHRVTPLGPDGADLRRVRRGYALLPWRRDDCPATSFGEEDSLGVVADRLFPAEREPGSGWLVPSAIGFRLLESPLREARRGVRDPNTPHVFAEPGVGIAELVSVRNPRLTDASSDELQASFWRWHTCGNLVLFHPCYAPAI